MASSLEPPYRLARGTVRAACLLAAAFLAAAALYASSVPAKAALGAPATVVSFDPLHKVSLTNLDGAHPWSALVDDGRGDNLMYGVAGDGGANGSGTIFTVSLSGSVNVVYSFSALTGIGVNSDGAHPYSAPVPDGIGGFYGATRYGGFNGTGTIYHLLRNGQLNTMYSFSPLLKVGHSNFDGAFPNGLILGTNGLLYGSCTDGAGHGSGSIFSFNPSSQQLLILHAFQTIDGQSFSNSDGARPTATLARAPTGTLFGGTAVGGKFAHGTLFQITAGGAFKVLHTFSNFTPGGVTNTDGDNVSCLILGNDNKLYGTCYAGGKGGSGTIFKLTQAGVFTVLHQFQGLGSDLTTGYGCNDEGAFPNGLVETGDDLLYGTASAGGTQGCGCVFQIATSGQDSSFESLNSSTAASVEAPFTVGPDGNLYTTTMFGGSFASGSVIEVAP